MNQPLFRPESLKARRPALEGDVVVHNNGLLFGITIAIFSATICAALLIAFLDVSRTQQVPGWLTTTKGLVQVHALRAGTIQELRVTEGQHVKRGQIIALIRSEELRRNSTDSVEVAKLALMEQQRSWTQEQVQLAEQQAGEDHRRVEASIQSTKAQLRALDAQIYEQEAITSLAKSDTDSAEPLANQGAISQRELRALKANQAMGRRDLAGLLARRAQLSDQLSSSNAELVRTDVTLHNKVAEFQGAMLVLDERGVNAQQDGGYTLVAPVDGRIANLISRNGYAVDPRVPLMSVIPDGAQLRADLFVPSSAVAFIQPGQEVRVMYDAFPYAIFGSHSARLTSVAGSATNPNYIESPVDIKEPVYLASAALKNGELSAFGAMKRLQPGMTLRATIILEKRSVFQWIFAPVFAVRGRL